MSNALTFVHAPLVLAEVPELLVGFAVVLFLIVSLLMMLVVLIQKPQGGGLSGAFGAGAPEGSGQTAFGAKTGDVLTTATIGIFILFLGTAVGLNFLIGPPQAPRDAAQVAPAEDAAGGATRAPGGDGAGAADGTFDFEFEPNTPSAGESTNEPAEDPAGDGGEDETP